MATYTSKTLTGGGTADTVGTGREVFIYKMFIYTDGAGNAATVTMTDDQGNNVFPASGLKVAGYGCAENHAVFDISMALAAPVTVTLSGTNAEGVVFYRNE